MVNKDKKRKGRKSEKVKEEIGAGVKVLDLQDVRLQKAAKEKKKAENEMMERELIQEYKRKHKKEEMLKKHKGKDVETAEVDTSEAGDIVSAPSTKGKMKNTFRNLWITKDIAATMGRDIELKLTLRDTINFAIFFVFVTIACIHNISKFDFYLTRMVKVQFDTDGLTLIHSQAQLWTYLEGVFIDGIFWKTWFETTNETEHTSNTNDDLEILQENILIGAPRIKQVRVRNNSCKVHKYFAAHFKCCYGEFSSENQDKRPYGPKTGTEWIYQSAKVTGSPTNRGAISLYDGGGYYTDLTMSKAKTRQLLKDLKDKLWINRGTRALNINFSIYNGNLNLFSLIDFLFEFPPTGGIMTTPSITTVKVVRYVGYDDYLILACELMIFGYLIYFTFEEIRDLSVLRWSYFREFWSYTEWAIIGTGYVLAAIELYRYFSVRSTLLYYRKNPGGYINLEYIADLMVIFNNCSAALLFLTYIKLFKYINFNKTMGQLNITLAKCRKDVSGFAVMFMIIFIAFSAVGYLLFGNRAESFNDFGYSMLTLLKTILGDFDYNEIRQANPTLAPIFFVLFIFLVFFVLLNMFLAIINDTYTDVKAEIASGKAELQVTTILSRGCFNFCRKIGCKGLKKKVNKEKSQLTVTLEAIKNVLNSCGFTDLEIEMFFQRYNIDPTVKLEEMNVKNLMEELKGKYSADQSDHPDGPIVPLTDFIEQQRRLEGIEKAVGKLSNSLQSLLRKLEQLESVRRIRIS